MIIYGRGEVHCKFIENEVSFQVFVLHFDVWDGKEERMGASFKGLFMERERSS